MSAVPAIVEQVEQKGGALVVQGPISEPEWRLFAQIANVIGNTEFVPQALRNNKPALMACLMYGRDQGVPPMIALSEIFIVDGKPTMSANLMVAKARANGNKVWAEEHRDDQQEVIAITAHGERADGTEDAVTWTLKMAERAGLLNNPKKLNWAKYPESMLWARAVSALCRRLFSDAFLGSTYTVEEIEEGEFDEPSIQALALERGTDAGVPGVETPAADSAADMGSTPVSPAAEVSDPGPPQETGSDGPGGTSQVGAGGDGDADAADSPPDIAPPATTGTTSGDFVVDSGKYSHPPDGPLTVAQVAAVNPTWLHAAKNYKSGPLKDAITDFLAEHPEVRPQAEPAQQELA